MDIACGDQADSEIVLSNQDADGQPLRLKKQPGARYSISITNTCKPHKRENEDSDFTYYYDVFSYQSGERFDLKHQLTAPGISHKSPLLITPEVVCNFGFLSQFKSFLLMTLGLDDNIGAVDESASVSGRR